MELVVKVVFGPSDHLTGDTLFPSPLNEYSLYLTSNPLCCAYFHCGDIKLRVVKLPLQHFSCLIEGLWGSVCGETHSAK